jgi:hypothetical protein
MRTSVKVSTTLHAIQILFRFFATIDLECRSKYHPRNSRHNLNE